MKTKLERQGWTKIEQSGMMAGIAYRRKEGARTFYISVSFSGPGKGMYGNRGSRCSGSLSSDRGHIKSANGNGSDKAGVANWLGRHFEFFRTAGIREKDYERFLKELETIQKTNELIRGTGHAWDRERAGFPGRTIGGWGNERPKPAERYQAEKRAWFERQIATRDRASREIERMKQTFRTEQEQEEKRELMAADTAGR